ncbi:MAG: glycosyltransferase family 9 protein [Bdellovibrionaceae bacterium]|nr:glycosyltransferase family 9 protein [Pseudobdellovibrionaceae bacterium]
MSAVNCRHFNGYKPCSKNTSCGESCHSYSTVDKAILVIHLGAMGSVVRSTALLRKIKELNPDSYVVWLTERPSHEILKFHPAIDKILELSFESLLSLKAFSFETVYALDKDLKTAGLLPFLNVKAIKGFSANPITGSIQPVDQDAHELWTLGLSNQKKFFENKKSEIQLLFETCGFEFNFEPYWLHLSELEQAGCEQRRQLWLGSKKYLIGINTGCGNVITYKKMSTPTQIKLVGQIKASFPDAQIVLLGGKDETTINDEIHNHHPDVILSDTQKGLRDGLQSIAAVDVLISGDSFAMHAGIAFGKYTLAWFGPTCAHEVEFYGKGAAIDSDFACSPCWKRDCSKERMCYDHADTDQFIKHLMTWADAQDIESENNKEKETSLIRDASL